MRLQARTPQRCLVHGKVMLGRPSELMTAAEDAGKVAELFVVASPGNFQRHAVFTLSETAVGFSEIELSLPGLERLDPQGAFRSDHLKAPMRSPKGVAVIATERDQGFGVFQNRHLVVG